MNLALNCRFSQSYIQYYDINCKTVTIFFLLIIQLTVYNVTTRFIADDEVVYQRVRPVA